MMRRFLAQLMILAVAGLAIAGLSGVSRLLAPAAAEALPPPDSSTIALNAQLSDAEQQLERAHQIIEFSGRYRIPADLAAKIYDIAVEQGIPASVGFQLVKVESGFHTDAESSASAIGLTQLQLATARNYDATVNSSDLMNASVNLRIGFRYLKDLITRFDHNLPLALEAYNKGPGLVAAQRSLGLDVTGRYSDAVLRGVHIRG